MTEDEQKMLRFFDYGHLPDHLRQVLQPFRELAVVILERIDAGPQRTASIERLLDSRECAVRAKLYPGESP